MMSVRTRCTLNMMSFSYRDVLPYIVFTLNTKTSHIWVINGADHFSSFFHSKSVSDPCKYIFKGIAFLYIFKTLSNAFTLPFLLIKRLFSRHTWVIDYNVWIKRTRRPHSIAYGSPLSAHDTSGILCIQLNSGFSPALEILENNNLKKSTQNKKASE